MNYIPLDVDGVAVALGDILDGCDAAGDAFLAAGDFFFGDPFFFANSKESLTKQITEFPFVLSYLFDRCYFMNN